MMPDLALPASGSDGSNGSNRSVYKLNHLFWKLGFRKLVQNSNDCFGF
ncbi:hypothetical protein Hanom_Chr17g01524761 [Helianthus anomalus]